MNIVLPLILFLTILVPRSYAACGATDRTWIGQTNTNWGTNANWVPGTFPNATTVNAIIVTNVRNPSANTNVSVGCLDVQSGILSSVNNRTITVAGDYVKSLATGGLNVNAAHNFTFALTGTTTQAFDVVDPVNTITISNNTTVNFGQPFTIRTALTLSGTTTTLNINDDLTYSSATLFTIPAGNTVNIAAGKTLYMSGSITVNGTLRLNPGAQMLMAPGTTITVNAGGQLRLEGASGNIASIVGNGGYYNLAVAGTLYANYFRFNKVGADLKGVSVTGTLSSFSNGEVLFINNNGYGLTLGPAAVIPTTFDAVGFYDNSGFGTAKNINATGFNVSSVTVNNWAGLDSTFETDPNNRITWGTQAGTVLNVSQNTNAGRPVTPVTAGAAAAEWLILSFSLNQVSAATDITSLSLTMTGTADLTDVVSITLYNQGATCQTRGAIIGTAQVPSGTPGKVTFSIPAATVTVSDTNAKCVHAYLQTSSSAVNGNTVGLSLEATGDVTNSQGYSFSPTSGPPVQSSLATISGSATSVWDGSTSGNWATNSNWTPATAPTLTRSCTIGSGTNSILMNANRACINIILNSGGTINWSNTAFTLSAYGAFDIQSGFTFQTATNGTLQMLGANNQTFSFATAWPGNMIINNSGGVTKLISVTSDTTINGNLTLTSGTLVINPSVTLTVLGNITVQTGTVLKISGGGTLKLANGRTLTVNAGGTLEMVGSGSNATMTSTSTAAGYTVIVNGTIKADQYAFSNLGTNGVTINSGATIDPTYNLSNGSFSYPVSSNSTFLRLFKAIPGNTMSSVQFASGGSAATNVKNIYTDATIGAGTLTISNYSGDLSGATFDNDNTYLISWTTVGNKIVVAQGTTSPTNVNQGQVGVVMGRFTFNQQNTGSTSADITSLKLTLTGTGAASYIDAVKIYYDSGCTSSGGVLLGTGTYSGSPATLTFSGLTGATIPASLTTPPTRCIYVTYDISATAPNASTLGVSIAASTDIVDSQAWGIANTVGFPVTLGAASNVVGTSTTWTGAVSTAWATAGNWNGGVPSATLNCIINSAANNPIISTGTVSCKSLTVGTGNLTINVGSNLQVYGNLSNSGTITNNGTLTLRDDGVSIANHTLTLSSALSNVVFANTIGGAINYSGAITLNGLTMNGSNYNFNIGNGRSLTLPAGMTINGGTLTVSGGGSILVANGQTLTLSGGTLWLNGTSEASPQNLATKAKITVSGAGTWNFNSTSGTLKLQGFQLDYISTNGLVIGGSTILSNFDGGQFTNLSSNYAAVKVVQVNTTGTIPTTANNVGFNFTTTPASTDGYKILSSTGCSNRSMDFAGWFGNWAENVATFDVTTKISQVSCNLSLGAMASAVSLLSFTATPYDQKIDLKWETITESDHLGFNILRDDGTGNLVQINEQLLRNIFTPGSFRGKYRFIDTTALNDVRYYYYIQDISFTGTTKIHGSVSAMAKSGLGLPPADQTNENSGGNNGSTPTPPSSTIPNPTYEDLGDGVVILAQSNSTLRLKITPPAAVFAASTWNPSYKSVTMSGYSKQAEIGKPEALQKTILIEVSPDFSTATLESNSKSTSLLNGKLLQPAPSYTLVGSNLVAQYAVNASVYSQNSFGIEDFYSVSPTLISIGERKYLKIDVKPLFQNPVTQEIKSLTEATLDISLNGNGWDQTPPSHKEANAAYITNNALAISYTSAGMYELSYDQMVDSSVEGPFNGAHIDDLRLFHQEDELPIEIVSADSYFNSGDKIRFYVDYFEYAEHFNNVAILTTANLYNRNALRMDAINGDPTGVSQTSKISETAKVLAETNAMALLSAPLGEEQDHFYWGMIYATSTVGGAPSYKDFSVNLESIDTSSSQNVELAFSLKGASGSSLFTKHSLEVYINNVVAPLASFSLENQDPTVSKVSISSNYFHPGNNKVRIKVTAAYTLAGEYDIVYVNKLNVSYPKLRISNSDYFEIANTLKNKAISITGFSTNLLKIYDISSSLYTSEIVNPLIQNNAGDYSVYFNTNDEGDFNLGRKYLVLSDSQYKTVASLNLIRGAKSLYDPTNKADYIIIAERKMIPHLSAYLDHKATQGLNVKAISLEQIFNEFSHGRKDPSAIKSFIDFAYTSWTKPQLKYILLIGDTTYDPKDYLGLDASHHRVPSQFVKGMVYDYPSDHWFTTKDSSQHMPRVALGRIPSNDSQVIKNYLKKVMDYEDGVLSPDLTQEKRIQFFNTKSESLENFEGKTQELASNVSLANSNFKTSRLSFSDYSLNDFNNSLAGSFDQNNFLINFMGHGAEDRWAAENGDVHFNNTQATNLSNSKLPIVMALNCLNANFQEADASVVTLAEKSIFNENGGAIAFIASSTMTTSMAQFHFANNFFTEMGNASKTGNTNTRLGDVFMLTKIALGDDNYNRDVLYSYNIVGDPSLKFPEAYFEKVKTNTENNKQNSSLLGKTFGCDANASDGKTSTQDGILELLGLALLFILARKLKFS
ncbi:MAG: hypothetical protein K2P81_06160 [Bacteriovoracaceae bacterium]|nr:hypothetical protein [Bacteriovoracaceae bacterium]